MTNYTLLETETQLRDLVTLTQNTHQPIALQLEEAAQPVAFLLTSQIYEAFRRQERQLFWLQLKQLLNLLDKTEEQWDEDSVRHTFIQDFPTGMRSLWDTCPEKFRRLCAMLRMASQRLSYSSLSQSKIQVLRSGLELFRVEVIEENVVENYYSQLLQSGLPPAFTGDAELVKLYVDEL